VVSLIAIINLAFLFLWAGFWRVRHARSERCCRRLGANSVQLRRPHCGLPAHQKPWSTIDRYSQSKILCHQKRTFPRPR